MTDKEVNFTMKIGEMEIERLADTFVENKEAREKILAIKEIIVKDLEIWNKDNLEEQLNESQYKRRYLKHYSLIEDIKNIFKEEQLIPIREKIKPIKKKLRDMYPKAVAKKNIKEIASIEKLIKKATDFKEVQRLTALITKKEKVIKTAENQKKDISIKRYIKKNNPDLYELEEELEKLQGIKKVVQGRINSLSEMNTRNYSTTKLQVFKKEDTQSNLVFDKADTEALMKEFNIDTLMEVAEIIKEKNKDLQEENKELSKEEKEARENEILEEYFQQFKDEDIKTIRNLFKFPTEEEAEKTRQELNENEFPF